MYSNVMKMPSTFSDLSADEMEYDGGFGLFAALVVAAVKVVTFVSTNAAIIGACCGAASLVTEHVADKTGCPANRVMSKIFNVFSFLG